MLTDSRVKTATRIGIGNFSTTKVPEKPRGTQTEFVFRFLASPYIMGDCERLHFGEDVLLKLSAAVATDGTTNFPKNTHVQRVCRVLGV